MEGVADYVDVKQERNNNKTVSATVTTTLIHSLHCLQILTQNGLWA